MSSSACQVRFLGSGSSMGVPVIGCHCPVCSSTLAENKRLRPSLLLSYHQRHFLIDSGPDFRLQALRYGINTLDGVILTHAHHDHTAGLDELRVYTLRSGKPLPCLLSEGTLHELQRRFYYIFAKNDPLQPTAHLATVCLPQESGKLNFEGIPLGYTTYYQGQMAVTGLRFGSLAYITDIKKYSPELFDFLKGVEILILSALRFTPSALHLTVDEAIEFAQKVGAKTTWLTHIAHELEYEKTNSYLPSAIHLSYDGLTLDFEGMDL